MAGSATTQRFMAQIKTGAPYYLGAASGLWPAMPGNASSEFLRGSVLDPDTVFDWVYNRTLYTGTTIVKNADGEVDTIYVYVTSAAFLDFASDIDRKKVCAAEVEDMDEKIRSHTERLEVLTARRAALVS